MKFKRAELVKPKHFEIFEVDETPKGNEVLVKIASCGLCNWELNFWEGKLNFMGYPHKLGHEWSGVVVETGPDCRKIKAGDKVSGLARGFGGYAEYKVVSEDFLQILEEHVDPVYALGEPQKCIMTVLRGTAPEAGDHGVVLGCGPMGMWCIQALSGHLLGTLTAIDIDDKKLQEAGKFGATHTINSQKENVEERIKEITKGHMADFVIEGTGIPALLNEAQRYMKTGGRGRLVLMSSHHAPAPEFDFRIAVDKCFQIIVPHPGYSANEYEDFRRAVSFINNGTFRTKELVTHEFRLSEINRAFETLENKPADFMKGIVIPD
ncbi:MAG: zinc-binding dehydrogenase [Lachnospiraceae bacterium]|nr:zinc-binding dehydrogenase [Lachnospiraceae bacterium]